MRLISPPLVLATALWALFASSCATSTLNSKQCESRDWRAFGRVDGELGRDSNTIDRHREACELSHVTPDVAAYEEGRREGLKSFCTPEGGFAAGEGGITYNRVCESDSAAEKTFLGAYARGQASRSNRERLVKLSEERKELEEKNPPPHSLATEIGNALGVTEYAMRRDSIERETTKLTSENRELRGGLPRGVTEDRLSIGPRDFQNYAGVAVGFMGFGMGHLVQGRWSKKGWMFSASQFGALLASSSIAQGCEGAACKNRAIVAGVVAFMTSKVFEMSDLIDFAARAHEGYPHLVEAPHALPADVEVTLAEFRF